MKEDLLHYIWRYRLYDSALLATTGGEAVEVLQAGSYNTDAGADFSNARIRIDEVLLAGNVEIHVNQADWYAHGHQHDPAYNNTILHVVYQADSRPTLSQSGQVIPVLSLEGRISPALLQRYDLLKTTGDTIACASLIGALPEGFSLMSYYDRLVIERLQSKVAVVEGMLNQSINDWDQVAFQMIAMYFGASVNKEPFAMLARSLPLTVLHKHRAEPLQIEALLYGQAGMLAADYDEEYPRTLKREYTYLKKLHSLTPMGGSAWKFFRIRPAGFPTIKIAQLAALLLKEPNLFSAIVACKTLTDFRQLFEVAVHPYWQAHYQFDKPAKNAGTAPGSMLTDVVLINAIAPLLFSYGRYRDDEVISQGAMDLLSAIPAEDNAIIRMWDSHGIKASTANDTQALLQLKNQYCDNRRCLHCQIGHKLLA